MYGYLPSRMLLNISKVQQSGKNANKISKYCNKVRYTSLMNLQSL